jgi:hypothetical protein
VQGRLDVLDEAYSVPVEGFGEVNVFGVLFTGDRPFGGVDNALSSVVGVRRFPWILGRLSLCLLVGDDELVLLHVVAESLAEGELGMGDDVGFGQRPEFVDRIQVCCLSLVDQAGVGAGCWV